MKRLVSEIGSYLLYPLTAIGLLLLANAEYHLWKLHPLVAILGTVLVAFVGFAYIYVMSTLPIQTVFVDWAKRIVDQLLRRFQRARDRLSHALDHE
jgi:hypothetical protein